MPARRSRVPVGGPPLEDYPLPELLGLLSNWYPPGHASRRPKHDACRWRSWAEFVADARRLHPELLAKFRTGLRAGLPPMFAERVIAFVDRYGLQALDGATYDDLWDALSEAPR